MPADLVAVRINGDGRHPRAREHQRPRRRLAPVLVVIRGLTLTGRQVVDEHGGRRRPHRTRHVCYLGGIAAVDCDRAARCVVAGDSGRIMAAPRLGVRPREVAYVILIEWHWFPPAASPDTAPRLRAPSPPYLCQAR